MSDDGSDIVEWQHWLIRAKLEAPRQQISLVDRPRLLGLLDAALSRRLCLVVAPAGFGKTTLLAQWRQRQMAQGAKIAWLTLDESDGEVRQFLCYVIFALATAGVDMGRLLHLAEQGLMELSLPASLAAVLEAVMHEPASVALILDDYHRAQSAEVDALVNRMLETSPGNFTLVLNSRQRPALTLPQLLAAGKAMEIDVEALRFSQEETRAAVDPFLADDQLQLLFQRTEGWPMAIQLARLVVGDGRPKGQLLDAFHGHSGHLAAYLADQVITKLPTESQEFLIRTSICERFNAALANAVLERNDSLEALRRLEPLHSLLVPLDEQHEWFRYHHLFADYLQDLLRRRQPDLINRLHQRASKWFEDNGFVSEAVRHARLAGDYDCCARLIEEAGAWELILYGGIGYLRNLLRNMPDKELERFPRLQVARAYLALKDGQILAARSLLEEARANPIGRHAEADSTVGLGRDLLNVGVLQDVYEDRSESAAGLENLRALIAATPESDGVTRGVLICAETLRCLALGRLDGAAAACSLAVRAMRQANTVLGLNYCYLHAGLAAFYQAKFRLAEASFWEARRLAEDNFGADSGLRSLADVLLGCLLFWRDEWQEGDAERLRAAFDHVKTYDGWFEIYANALDVEMASNLMANDEAAAEEAIHAARRIVETRGIERLARLADAHLLELRWRQGKAADGSAVAADLEKAFPRGAWRRAPFLWRPYQQAAIALAGARGDRDRATALYILDDLIDCCRACGADFYLIKALIARAVALDQAGQRAEALAALFEALTKAAPERIRMPFRLARRLQPLLYAAQKKAREETTDTILLGFIASCLGRDQSAGGRPKSGAESLFSPREYEVLLELAQGHSNKEIARTLDLTEHTVKFHLKNIFAKLKVERRAEVIATVRRMKLLDID